MSRRILVVGGAGYIGSHMVRRLVAAGEETVVLDNLSNGHRAAVAKEARFYEGDLGNREWVAKLLKAEGITDVMHFASYISVGESVGEPLKYYDNNVGNTIRLLLAMRDAGVTRFVFSSTAATYGNPQKTPIAEDHPQAPINPYGETKLVIENLLRDMAAQKQISYAALRYFNASGASSDATIGEDHRPESHLIPLLLQVALGQRENNPIFGDDYPTPDGTCLRDYIHVEDLAEAHLRALNLLREPGTRLELNLSTGKPSSVKEIVEVCRKITGHSIPIVVHPRRAGDPAILTADVSKAKTILGWEPQHEKLEEIVSSAWAWHKSHPKGYKK